MTFCREMVVWCGVFFGVSVLARADVTYSYVGTPLTAFQGMYTTGDRVTGTFTLAAPLLPGLDLEMVDPLAFSFTDGLQTITKQNAYSYYVEVGTYPSTNPTDAGVDFLNASFYSGEFYDPENVGEPFFTGLNVYISALNGASPSGYDLDSPAVDETGYSSGPGTLSLSGASSAAAPEPGSFALLGSGLVGLVGVFGRRRAGR